MKGIIFYYWNENFYGKSFFFMENYVHYIITYKFSLGKFCYNI